MNDVLGTVKQDHGTREVTITRAAPIDAFEVWWADHHQDGDERQGPHYWSMHSGWHARDTEIDAIRAKLEVVQRHYADLESLNFDITHRAVAVAKVAEELRGQYAAISDQCAVNHAERILTLIGEVK